VARLRAVIRPWRVLVDVRDDANLRGFHVLAGLYLVADRLRSVELYRVGGQTPDEDTACRAFAFDTGLAFRSLWRLLLVDTRFDVYLAAANDVPMDPASVAARRTSRRTILGLMFGPPDEPSALDALVIDGHDTLELARAVIDHLEPPADTCRARGKTG
jgi:hypothetical protein